MLYLVERAPGRVYLPVAAEPGVLVATLAAPAVPADRLQRADVLVGEVAVAVVVVEGELVDDVA